MNCEEFKNNHDAAPAESFDGRDEHLAGCSDCRALVEASTAFESVLSAALSVPVPEFAMPNLSETAQVVSIGRAAPRRLASRAGWWLAAAASVTLAVGIGAKVLTPAVDSVDPSQGAVLAAQLLDHMRHEPYALVVSEQAVASDKLVRVTHAADSQVDEQLGLVSYASSCEINGQTIPHLVVQGKAGPVTILILPNESVDGPITLDDDDFHGAILPVGGRGSVAIIGRKGESIDDIRERVRDSIRLSI